MLKKVLVSLTEILNSKNAIKARVAKEYPNETIIFASASTLLESISKESIGWSFKRFAQRRGVLVLTNERFYFCSNTFSLMTLLLLFIFLIILNAGRVTGDSMLYIIALVVLISIFQRRPYSKFLSLSEIIDIKIDYVRSIVGYKASLVTVVTQAKSYNFCTAEQFNFTKEKILGHER